MGVSQDLAVTQTGYITRQKSDYNITAYNSSVWLPSVVRTHSLGLLIRCLTPLNVHEEWTRIAVKLPL